MRGGEEGEGGGSKTFYAGVLLVCLHGYMNSGGRKKKKKIGCKG